MTNKGKAVRYFLILLIYNFSLAGSAFLLQWLDRWFFQFNMSAWTTIDWWCFISIAVLYGGFLLYIAPWLEKELYYRLDRRLSKIKLKLPTLEVAEEYTNGNDNYKEVLIENE